MTDRDVAVIGVGTIGTTICADLLLAGLRVVAVERDASRFSTAVQAIERAVRFGPMLRARARPTSLDEARSRFTLTSDLSAIAGCGVVIENVPERPDIKRDVYGQLDALCASQTLLAANTSATSITRLASWVRSPERVIGIHFMNPAYLTEVAEVIRGFHTSDATVQRARELLDVLGKEAIVVVDLPGFVSNRISHLMMNEAAWVLQDGLAPAKDIDQLFKKGFGHRMGPLETADLIGLDVVADTLDRLCDDLRDPKFRCCPLLRKMVDAGLLGQKSGRGFYDYHHPQGSIG